MLTSEKKWRSNTSIQNIILVNTTVNFVPRFVPPNMQCPSTLGLITNNWFLNVSISQIKNPIFVLGPLVEPWVCPQTGYIHCSKGCGSKFKNLAPLKRHEEVCTFSNLANIPKNVPLQVVKTDKNVASSDQVTKLRQMLSVKNFAKSCLVEPVIKEEKL